LYGKSDESCVRFFILLFSKKSDEKRLIMTDFVRTIFAKLKSHFQIKLKI